MHLFRNLDKSGPVTSSSLPAQLPFLRDMTRREFLNLSKTVIVDMADA